MFVKTAERNLARKLRREEGLSIRAIAERVGVALATVSVWVRDIELTPEQQERLRRANPVLNGQHRGQAVQREAARQRRLEAQQRGRRLARSGDPQHRAGCMLYWAEGAKSRNVVLLANSDPDLLRMFVRFLNDCYCVPRARMVLSVHAYAGNGLDLCDIETYWCGELGLPTTSLRKGRFMAASTDELKRRKLLYGTARVSVHSTAIVQSIYGAIQEYGGFERPEWLD